MGGGYSKPSRANIGNADSRLVHYLRLKYTKNRYAINGSSKD